LFEEAGVIIRITDCLTIGAERRRGVARRLLAQALDPAHRQHVPRRGSLL